MSAQPAGATHLHVVTGRTGEVERTLTLEQAREEIQHLNDRIAGQARDIAAWQMRYAELARDKDREARDHQLWPVAHELFKYWREVCNHPAARWNAERFWMILPHLKPRRGETPALAALRCKAAIAGLAFDHYSDRAKNGKTRHYNEWKHVFGSTDLFERRLRDAPLHVQAKLAAAIEQARNPNGPDPLGESGPPQQEIAHQATTAKDGG